jgi:ring-1,2-phenylacetyl-CoA epoxidase subunit PaaE
MTALHFHRLPVTRIEPLTVDAVCITLSVPPELRDAFAFTQGQYLTLRSTVNGEDMRRSYSLCNAVHSYAQTGELQVGIKRVEGGAFSSYACTQLQAGDVLQVLPPQGRFYTPLNAAQAKHYLGIAAGSGITPLLSLIATTLQVEPQARFTLIYGNRHLSSIMFSEALEALKNQHMGRLQLVHVLSRQATEMALLHGRMDEDKLAELLGGLLSTSAFHEAFVCGPEEVITAAERALSTQGMARERVHSERFATGVSHQPRLASMPEQATANQQLITVVLDGKRHEVSLGEEQTVLDAALSAGLDLPYSCKGGVCCTCRAKVIEGRVTMLKNYTLEQWEMDKGFVLTCQSRCVSESLTVSFDER